MKKELEKEFDEKFTPTWSKDIKKNDVIEIPMAVQEILTYNNAIKSFIDENFIEKVDRVINGEKRKCIVIDKPHGLYTKQQVLDMIGEDRKDISLRITAKGQPCYIVSYNQAKAEMRKKL